MKYRFDRFQTNWNRICWLGSTRTIVGVARKLRTMITICARSQTMHSLMHLLHRPRSCDGWFSLASWHSRYTFTDAARTILVNPPSVYLIRASRTRSMPFDPPRTRPTIQQGSPRARGRGRWGRSTASAPRRCETSGTASRGPPRRSRSGPTRSPRAPRNVPRHDSLQGRGLRAKTLSSLSPVFRC
jgi:hypothetical protein